MRFVLFALCLVATSLTLSDPASACGMRIRPTRMVPEKTLLLARADTMYQRGALREALRLYEHTLLDLGAPRRARSEAALGAYRIHLRRGNHAVAQHRLRRAIELNRNNATAQLALGLHLAKSEPADARIALRRAMSLGLSETERSWARAALRQSSAATQTVDPIPILAQAK